MKKVLLMAILAGTSASANADIEKDAFYAGAMIVCEKLATDAGLNDAAEKFKSEWFNKMSETDNLLEFTKLAAEAEIMHENTQTLSKCKKYLGY
ncbi:hypothetical protein FM038_014065 [Shewanella eurypsychrophilus]|uniref:Uncharacterized protein n=1 Tax=Shewanella eurypsychrophilus TaxID=2593656 RepID=A0ABX6VD82_9GAMM|nr:MULTISPECIES: hypothetical protein [Shewanella]QFU23160.1 hypothetical protein FS418_15645 [Shewanella sp. YLB-09]QPG58443.1 hypothetical protein FM038_014065 [Shewanella eurypsychrophilus]